MKCLKCGTENRDTAQFCRVCSQPFKAEITCPRCGQINLQDSKFCEKCGRLLTESTLQDHFNSNHHLGMGKFENDIEVHR